MTFAIKQLVKPHLSIFYFLVFTSYFSSAQQTQKIYLSGTGKDDTVGWEFFATSGRNSGKWTTIPVPSNWELQGFGKYDYGFAKDTVRGKEQGLYAVGFEAPPNWKNKQVNIVFEGVMTDAEVKVNGQSAGPIHQGAFYAFKYDITPLLRDGHNMLEVTVSKHSANAFVNEAERKADYWIFGGIFRPVYLEVLPKQHIKHLAIDAKANGSFTAAVDIKASTANTVSAQLITADGMPVGAPFIKALKRGDTAVLLQTHLPNAKQWTPETPNLYYVQVSLLDKGKIIHTTKKRFGFRTIEVKQRDGIYVNGVKVKMKGVNRHSFHPESGRTTSKQISIHNVLMMKDMNMNAVRMSHYPPDDHFLDACDSLGLFVMDELAGWHGNYDTKTGSKLLREMINHDVNHPSIVIWSNGNEGGHNFDLDSLFTAYDIQKRPVVHPWQLFGGIETQHYRQYNYGIGNYNNGREIVMPTEFLHGQFDGGHGAGLEDYWNMMWHDPLSAGGFLWDFQDQAVRRRDLNDSLDTDKHRGADGIVGPYYQKEGSYYTIKEVWSPVYVQRREITKDFDGKINIENRYHFTNTNKCSFTYSFQSLLNKNKQAITGNITAPSLKPGEKGNLQIALLKQWSEYDVLYLTAKDATNKEIFTWSFPITRPIEVAHTMLPFTAQGMVSVHEEDSAYTATASGVTVGINKLNGKLISVSNSKGSIPFANGPVIQEGANNFKNFSQRFDGDTLVIASTFDKKTSYNTLEWRVYPSGIVKMNVTYFPAELFTSMVGVNFSFPESNMKGVEYMGNGPYRVWRNRMKGNKFGVWTKAYNNTETGEQWNYPEFKGYHSNMYWLKFNTTTQPFTVYTENEDLFFRLFTPAWKTDEWHNYEPIFPSGDISFMHAISSIGNKTQGRETTGPMGQKSIFYDYEKDRGRALKMVLYFDFR